MTGEVCTDLSSTSLVGTGHVPGSRVAAWKKLYAHRLDGEAKMRWANVCDSVSKHCLRTHGEHCLEPWWVLDVDEGCQ